MKRFVCLIAAVCVCFSSAFAWNSESFLSDGSAEYQPYSLDPVEDPALDPAQVPMLMSLDDGVAVSSDVTKTSYSFVDLLPYWSSSAKVGIYTLVHHDENIINLPGQDPIVVPEFWEERIYPDGGMNITLYNSGSYLAFFGENYVAVPNTLNGGTVEEVGTPIFYVDTNNNSVFFDVDLDVSSFGSFDTFSLSGTLSMSATSQISSSSNIGYVGVNTVQLFVDGDLQKEYGVDGQTLDFGGYVYAGSSPVTSVSLRINFDILSVDYISTPLQPRINFNRNSTLQFDILSGDTALDGFNDQAQDDINEHQSIESEWTGSMTQNFNALDLSGFTFPGGLVSAFALITGIFNDLWNGMGDYKILYVFPLTLGVVLLLIGRISKFSGRSSSGRGGKGDDSA